MKKRKSDERDADHRDALVDLAGDGAAADALDEREGDVAAVERQQRQQVHQREREADQAEHPEVVLHALFGALVERLRDPDRARDVLAALAVDEAAERLADLLRDVAGQLDRLPGRLADAELLAAKDEAEPVGPVDLLRPDGARA